MAQGLQIYKQDMEKDIDVDKDKDIEKGQFNRRAVVARLLSGILFFTSWVSGLLSHLLP